jgi:hypothetical protein
LAKYVQFAVCSWQLAVGSNSKNEYETHARSHLTPAQDTNKSQYEIVRLLAGDAGNVFVVGDTDQVRTHAALWWGLLPVFYCALLLLA